MAQNLIAKILELISLNTLTAREISKKLGTHPKGTSSALRWLMEKVGDTFGVVGEKDGLKIYGFLNINTDWQKVLELYVSRKGTKSVKKVVLKRRQLASDVIAPKGLSLLEKHSEACKLIAQLDNLLTLVIQNHNPDSNVLALGKYAIEVWNRK